MSAPRLASRFAALVAVLATGCAAVGPSAAPSATPASPSPAVADRVDAARAELDVALAQLERIHPEPFHAVSREAFVAELEDLKARLPTLDPDVAAVELMRTWSLLAQERDGHQFAIPVDEERDQVLPIRVYEFAEGLYVTAAMPGYEELVGGRVTAVGDTPIADVLAAIEPLVPRDGPATVPSFRPLYFLRATVLRGLGIAPAGSGAIAVSVEVDGTEQRAELQTVSAADFVDWGGWLAFHGLPPVDGLRYTQPTNDSFSVDLLPGGTAVYVRYSQIQRVSSDDIDELERLAALPEVTRVIVDLRQNPGGDNTTYPQVVSSLRDAHIDQPGRLVLLTDRVTFSAASNFATEIEGSTSATFAGEPMGGGLNFWNDVDWIELTDFTLPLRVAISTRYWQKSTPDDLRLTIEPDLVIPVTAADYFAGRDVVLDRVLAGEPAT